MRTIYEPTDLIKKILPEQKYYEGGSYCRSRYCISVVCNEGVLLFNTLTGELVLTEPGREQQILVEHRFFVPEDFDEIKYVNDIRNIATLIKGQKKTVNHFTILSTTDCNARCFYCYEKGLRRFSMTEATAQKVIGYIERKHGIEPVKLSWFGGEPLYNIGVIDIITEGLLSRGIEYTSIMTSNGFYLTPEVSQRAKDIWHVGIIQITVDGTEIVYNRTKAYIDKCDNPFMRVMNNIKAALDTGLSIGVRLNMDASNAEDLFWLTDILIDRFEGQPNVHVHVEPLQEYVGQIHQFDSSTKLSQYYWELMDKLNEHGLVAFSELWRELRVNRCMADNDSSEVILPDGRVAKCEHVDENDIIGSIFDDTRDTGRIEGWKEIVCFPECYECPLYPLCISLKKCPRTAGGCLEHVRLIWEEQIKRKMLISYQEYKKKSQKE